MFFSCITQTKQIIRYVMSMNELTERGTSQLIIPSVVCTFFMHRWYLGLNQLNWQTVRYFMRHFLKTDVSFRPDLKKMVCDIYIYLSSLIRSSFKPSNSFFKQMVFLSQHWLLKSAFFSRKTLCLFKAKTCLLETL